jgi:hypothetical protein
VVDNKGGRARRNTETRGKEPYYLEWLSLLKRTLGNGNNNNIDFLFQ